MTKEDAVEMVKLLRHLFNTCNEHQGAEVFLNINDFQKEHAEAGIHAYAKVFEHVQIPKLLEYIRREAHDPTAKISDYVEKAKEKQEERKRHWMHQKDVQAACDALDDDTFNRLLDRAIEDMSFKSRQFWSERAVKVRRDSLFCQALVYRLLDAPVPAAVAPRSVVNTINDLDLE